MAKKLSGLGTGLGELLDDNTPEVAGGRHPKVTLRTDEKKPIQATTLFDDVKPKNKSLKANYR